MTEEELRARRRITARKEKRIRQMKRRGLVIGVVVLLVVAGILLIWGIRRAGGKVSTGVKAARAVQTKKVADRPDLDVDLLPINDYSRPGNALQKVNGIVVHYTANPGTTAQQNRDYFASLAETHKTSASSHFVIGLSGEIVQCIPCSEIAYASNERNKDTIAIECCIEDESGKFNDATYQALVKLVTWLMGQYDLDTDAVIRHYDVTGKNCPKYFVENPDAWSQFKKDLTDYIAKYGIAKEE